MGDRRKARRGHSTRSRWAVALATSIGLVALWLAPAARAASCNTSGGGATLNVTIASGQSVSVRINAANTILVDGGGLTDDNCGGNNAGTVNTIDVTGAAGNETLTINNSGAGGAFDDDDDFTIDLSSGTDTLIISGRRLRRHGRRSRRSHPTGRTSRRRASRTFTVNGNAGDDIVNGGTFAAGLTLNGGAGNDQLTGGIGNDTLNGGDGNDTINGNAGIDLLTYASAAAGVTVNLTTVSAQNTVGSGTDTIAGIENLTGTPANDSLTGSSTANTITGGGGDDLLVGGDGDDALNGGDGVDTVSYSTSAVPVTVNLSVTTAQNTGAGADLISNVENAVGGSGSDTLTGTAGANTLTGGPGNDTLTGGDGDDRLDGGDGRDRVVYASSTVGVTVNLTTATATGQGTDLLTSIENATGSRVRRLDHRAAPSRTRSRAAPGATRSAAREGATASREATAPTGSAAARVLDELLGGRGNDRGDAGGGNDLWKGGAGRDHIGGGAGRDTLKGGEAADVLNGGSGQRSPERRARSRPVRRRPRQRPREELRGLARGPHGTEPAPFRGPAPFATALIGVTQLWTTLDVSPPHTTPFASVIWLTFARNLPLLGGMYVLKLPLAVVAVVSTHFQVPPFCFWMTTGTNERQAVSPLETVTCPETRLCGSNPNPETVRATGAVVTVKSVALVAVPTPVVTEILPVVAPVGTVAVI